MRLKPKTTTLNSRALLYKRFINIEKGIAVQNVYKTTDGKFWLFNVEDYKFIEIEQKNFNASSKVLDVAINSVLSYKNIGVLYNEQYGWGMFEMTQGLYNNKALFYETLNRNNPKIIKTFTDVNPLILLQNATVSYSTNTSFTFSFRVYGKNIFTGKESLLMEETITTTTFETFKGSVPLDINAQTVITKVEIEANYTGQYSQTQRIELTINGSLNLNQVTDGRFNNMSKYQINKYYYVGSFDFVIKGSIEGTTGQYIKGNIMPLTAMNIKHFDDNIKLTTDDLVVVEGRLYSVENPETVYKQQPKRYNIHFATLNSVL